jgi:hypothetical protein
MTISSEDLRAWMDAKEERQQRDLFRDAQDGLLNTEERAWIQGYLACLEDLDLWLERESDKERAG